MLAAYGITSSNQTTYPLAKIQDALQAQTGALPYLGCSQNGTSLSEVWYFGHVFGTVSDWFGTLPRTGTEFLTVSKEQYGHFKPVDTTTESNCVANVYYYQRGADSEREVRSR